ncbi:MAG: metallophosphoesterase [Lentimicrobiaceae bacterium]|nr:metallophosphoesterase [Lentimicrobiaceae bacterium]HPG33200.1 metallophosphoesterase [Lentimicrobium sp.]
MKRTFYLLTTAILGIAFILLLSCNKEKDEPIVKDAFNNGTTERSMIVVISDIHLGADLAYAECNKNLPALENFLNQVRTSANVKELVIAGDLLDEWFVPAPIDTYQGKDQADFVQRIAAANKGVFDQLNSIIQEKKILVTYVPGNHDLTISEASVELILPGISQARDPELGLGTYAPEGLPKMAIEHGHRYNFFCAPDPFSNQDIAPGTITPPGYFFTRIAALHVSEGYPTTGDSIPVVTQNVAGDDSQNLLFGYWKVWNWALNNLRINESFNEPLIVSNINGLNGSYAVNDILPFQSTVGGVIDVKLYKGIQDSWGQRQTYNHVPVSIPAEQAIAGSASATFTDNQAKAQYFLNPASDVRLVVFGHSHVPTIEASTDHLGQKSIYVNSGTWIDHNNLDTSSMNFVVITPQNNDASSQTLVKLYQFKNEIIAEMKSDSLRF